MNAIEMVRKARTRLVLDHPFFGCLAMRLSLLEDKQFETAATNGKELKFNPDWIKTLPLRQVVGVLAHEVLHLALGHNWRQGTREHQRWNVAGDYAINQNLIDAGFSLPDGVLIDARFCGMDAEKIYALLPQNQGKGQGQGQGSDQMSDPGGCGAVLSSPDDTALAETKTEWKTAVAQAVQFSEGVGRLPSDLARQIQSIIKSPLPWYTLLRDFVERSARNDYSWQRPNSRYFNSSIILPGLISEELPEVVVAIDTSGSINQAQLDAFAAEASAVLGAYRTTIRVIYCDAKVKDEQIFQTDDLPIKLTPKGGGGTAFDPVFYHVNQQGYEPACLIYLTDLRGPIPQACPEYPVLWVTTNNRMKEMPFGTVIQLN